MKILVSGSQGLVGSSLLPSLSHQGHDVIALVRRQPLPGKREVRWDPAFQGLDVQALEDVDAVIHLAGENLASGRWTSGRKTRIRDSRVIGTKLLCQAMAATTRRPRVLLCASAVGYYGNRGDELLDENSSAGAGFLAEVCRDWEAATAPAQVANIRVVFLRFGMILSARGGALAKMTRPFKLGLGGILGSGRQFWSWIAIEDAVTAILHALAEDQLSGPVNVVSPNPVTNREFTKTLGDVLVRPTVLPVPALALRVALGPLADEALLASTRVIPKKLLFAGFAFRFPNLRSALDKAVRSGADLHQ